MLTFAGLKGITYIDLVYGYALTKLNSTDMGKNYMNSTETTSDVGGGENNSNPHHIFK